MPQILISDPSPVRTQFPDLFDLTLSGNVVSYPLLIPRERGLRLWTHKLPIEETITFARPAEDHVFYVVSGKVEARGTEAGPSSVIAVARGAEVSVVARSENVELLHYIGDSNFQSTKEGGCVHIVGKAGLGSCDEVVRGYRMIRTLYADSDCPTCSIWLHKVQMAPSYIVRPHRHSEDEIIYILEGELMFGTRAIGTGSAVAVPENSYYSFSAGKAGLEFLNFRQSNPFVMLKGDPPESWKSERENMRDSFHRSPAIHHLSSNSDQT